MYNTYTKKYVLGCHHSINIQHLRFLRQPRYNSQEHISPAMNAIILIFHFPFFKQNRSILDFIFLYHSPLQLSVFA